MCMYTYVHIYTNLVVLELSIGTELIEWICVGGGVNTYTCIYVFIYVCMYVCMYYVENGLCKKGFSGYRPANSTMAVYQ